MLLLLLSLLGISATRTAVIEVRIAANDRVYKRIFYLAEAAAMEGLQLLANSSETQIEDRSVPGLISGIDMSRESCWRDPDNRAISRVHPNAAFAIVDNGLSQGEAEGTLRHDFAVYGRYSGGDGSVMIVIGFRRQLSAPDDGAPADTGSVYFWREISGT